MGAGVTTGLWLPSENMRWINPITEWATDDNLSMIRLAKLEP
ncbi:hypothetical protein YPPY36_0098 [Yersinia pestis PY-36]|nr:hypothetical protein YpMG051020_0358 [Yersinia pestis biovar Orientalis str. MG05-1020]EIR27695.1 hypothetical protein YPPY09_0009 [Yersinia pestis PY-09]EIR96874.1 hypothetical protein YPPY36_0098 [Yersinia pestis PY-36]EIT34196.1 hypothetical protein YPPY95_0047 [Yersinia pestis PY-95]